MHHLVALCKGLVRCSVGANKIAVLFVKIKVLVNWSLFVHFQFFVQRHVAQTYLDKVNPFRKLRKINVFVVQR